MANRKNTFLLKRSNIAGKVPAAGDLLLGELALNISDVILYASGTTTNSILPIGWDRLARTGDTMTGGLFTPYLTATTISATSINKVDYIVFNTGTTSAATQAGTVYFDNNEHALSYNTSINQGVTVNLGQQNYLRVFNNSGADIPRGKALEVLSAYSGLPSVTLAINKHTGLNIIGVSAEIIPNNSEGIAITNGIISNIELTGMTIGSLVYASDTVAGRLDDVTNYLNFPLTARTNQVGYVVQTGATTGKLFIDINNENSVLSLTDLERNVLEGNVISTGAFEFTGMTTASTTTFNIAPLKGWLVKNTYEYALTPDVQSINYTGDTNIPVINIASADSTYILINSGLTITQQITFPTPQQRRENIYLGKVNHPNRTSILNINNTVDYDVSPMSALRDLWSPIKLINQGIIPSPNGANLSFNTSAGILWGNGINWHNNQLSPNNVIIAGKSPASFNYRTQTGGTSTSVTVIDPRNYDVGGVITSIGNANLDSATNQRIYMYPTGVINVLYGQTVYASLTAAVAAVQSEAFIPYPNAEANGILIGILSVRNDIGTDGQPLSNTSYAKFTFVSKFGESFGGTGGLSTTTLQQAYDNSTSPEIVINAALDGLSIKNGTGNSDITTRLLEGLNAAGNATSFIRADGDISGTTLQTNGFTGNTTGMSALTVNIRTIGSGTPLTNLGIDSSGNVVSGTTGGSTFTGGTVSGPTTFTNGLTANTISATTYYGLPTDVYSTGGTYNGSNLYITNNTGGTFTITGLTASGFSANYYGSFSDSTSQPVSGANVASVWTYNTTELSNGISVVNGSQIKVANKGVYEIGYSAQIEKTLSTSADVTIWAAINGVPVTRSSSLTSLVANSVIQLPFVSFIFELNANDYVEFYFSSPSQYVQLSSYSGLTSPTRPNAPSVIIVAKQVGLSVTDNLSGNYLPLSGGTITGDLIVSGNTQSWFSGNSASDLVRITQTGSGNALVIEDSNNPDSTPFVVNTSGFVGIGISSPTNPLHISGSTDQIRLSNGSSVWTVASKSNGDFAINSVGTRASMYFGSYGTTNSLRIGPTGAIIVNSSNDSQFTGVGNVIINNGLSANTISATTYYNLPTDIFTTGGTYSSGTTTFTNNTGGTFTVTGFSTSVSPISVVNTSSLFSTGLVSTGLNASGVTHSIFFGRFAGRDATSASNSNFLGNQAGYGATNAYQSIFIGASAGVSAINSNDSNFFGASAGDSVTNANNSNFFGLQAGSAASDANNSNFFGQSAGYQATGADNSNFMGYFAGYGALNAHHSNFLGYQAGSGATNAYRSNFFGYDTGNGAVNAYNSNFIGNFAGRKASDAYNSNFIGQNSGYNASGASYSTLLGYNTGYASLVSNSIGSNNIIIGTNISFSANTANAINIGGVLFGTGTYSATTGNPIISASTGGRIGIGIVNPLATLHVSGDTLIQGNLTVTGGTQSWFSGDSTSDLVRITQTGIGNAFVVEDSVNPDSTSFVINSNGAVGIGTTTPSNVKLDIVTSGSTPGTVAALRIRESTSNSQFSITAFSAATNGKHLRLSEDTTGTAVMVWTQTGNVGIGTNSPTEKLHVSGNTLIQGNLTVTGNTQSLFSGNSSVELIKIIQNGSGDAFVVQDIANGDASHFVINASGNTAIGLTQPLGTDKLTVSGNTTIYGTLSATTYAGLPNAGVLVVPIATSSVAVGTGSNDYYLNFKIPYNLTISKVDFSVSTAGSDSVRIGIYRGQDLTAVLVGQSSGGTVSTLNSVPIVAESGQNLTFSGGSWIVIGVAVGGITTNLYGSACPANNLIAWTNTTDSSGGFPANPRSKAGTRTSFPSIEITVA